MSVKMYFESMTPGMVAKLETRYRTKNGYAQSVYKSRGNGFSNGLQKGLFERFGRTLALRSR
jgi:hypothetical protein